MMNNGPFSSSIIEQPIIEQPIIEEEIMDFPIIRETKEVENISNVRDDTDILFITTHGSIMCDEMECEIENKQKVIKSNKK